MGASLRGELPSPLPRDGKFSETFLSLIKNCLGPAADRPSVSVLLGILEEEMMRSREGTSQPPPTAAMTHMARPGAVDLFGPMPELHFCESDPSSESQDLILELQRNM
tara:strand:- start:249 stop:572 length:324 start_codon:yes stop_codon:yes gene_type:complete